jgi:hypothetical protein
MVAALMVPAHGLHHFVNGWCNYHCSLLTMASLFLRVGCTSCCPLMANPNILLLQFEAALNLNAPFYFFYSFIVFHEIYGLFE